MKRVVVALVLVGCGRVGFDGSNDATVADARDARDAGYATPAIVQANGCNVITTSTTLSCTLTADVQIGNTLIFETDFSLSSPFPDIQSLTDSLGNTFTRLVGPDDQIDRVFIFESPITVAGSETIVETLSATSGYINMRMHEVAGLAAPALVASSSRGGSSNDGELQLGDPVTTTAPNDLVFAVSLANFVSAADPYLTALAFYGDVSEYLVATDPGTYTPVVTVGTGPIWSVSTIVLHAATLP